MGFAFSVVMRALGSCWGVWLSVAWMTGYLPERMLSFDNLFVFHMIFSVYGTPSCLKHRPP